MHITSLFGSFNEYSDLTFKGMEGITKLALVKSGTPYQNSFIYKKNGTWDNYTLGQQINIEEGQTISFRGLSGQLNTDNYPKETHATNKGNYHFTSTGDGYIEVMGNIQSLINFNTTLHPDVFAGLFFENKRIKSAQKLILRRFWTGSHECLFNSCSNLILSPKIPNTVLGLCLNSAFAACSNLTITPALPATELAVGCYFQMIRNTKITDIVLPATELVKECYRYMLRSDSQLKRIEVNFTQWKDDLSATFEWVLGVANTGTFICPAALPHTSQYFDVSHIPPGWTVITK